MFSASAMHIIAIIVNQNNSPAATMPSIAAVALRVCFISQLDIKAVYLFANTIG